MGPSLLLYHIPSTVHMEFSPGKCMRALLQAGRHEFWGNLNPGMVIARKGEQVYKRGWKTWPDSHLPDPGIG